MKDCKGQEIQVGDQVVVAGRQGSSQWLSTVKVIGFQTKERYMRDPIELPVLEWPQKKGVRRLAYSGSANAIMVMPKGPQITFPKIEMDSANHDPGDENRSGAW